MMKKFLFLALTAALWVGCVDDLDCNDNFEVVSFETLVDIDGEAVVLGDITVEGGTAAGTHEDIFWGKGGTYSATSIYDGVLCSTADGAIEIGTFFVANDPDAGGYGDYWSGFVVSGNYDTSATVMSYQNQFSAWATSGVGGSKTSLIGYDDGGFWGAEYERPAIKLVAAREVDHIYIANTAITATYEPSSISLDEYYYKVVIIGELAGTETSRVEVTLVDGSSILEGWQRVDLSSLGEVDCLRFEPASNDSNTYGLLAPAFFAVDNLTFKR